MYIVWEVDRSIDSWEVRKGNKIIDSGSYEYCVDVRRSLNGSNEYVYVDVSKNICK